MTFDNTLLTDVTPHKSMFNPPCSAIFFEIFYRFDINNNYLVNMVLPYLESLHWSEMRVYKYEELNPFSNITNVPLGDPWYGKLNVCCSTKCDETFCNKVESRFVNKKR